MIPTLCTRDGDFEVGDLIRITLRPNREYTGVLQDVVFGPCAYLILNGCGFPLEDIIQCAPWER